MSRRTTKQRRSARRRRFAYHLARCRALVAKVGPWRIISACVAIWDVGARASGGGEGDHGRDS
jgi:hypothetical protein